MNKYIDNLNQPKFSEIASEKKIFIPKPKTFKQKLTKSTPNAYHKQMFTSQSLQDVQLETNSNTTSKLTIIKQNDTYLHLNINSEIFSKLQDKNITNVIIQKNSDDNSIDLFIEY